MFSFNGVRAIDMGVMVRKCSRELKPQRRVVRTQIGGRDGSYDYSDGTYSNTIIQFDCTYVGRDIDRFKDKVALWIANEGILTFDTAPEKHYTAHLYETVPLDHMIFTHEFTLSFECFPFAMSDTRQITITANKSETEIGVRSDGTQHTPCIIIIRNIGTANITGITITLKANIL